MGIKIYVIMAICSPAFSVKWIGKKLDKFEVRICLKKYITSSIDDDYVRRVVEWTELVVIILFETGQEWLAGWWWYHGPVISENMLSSLIQLPFDTAPFTIYVFN